ncbi:MAG: hypothetical protein KAW41_05360 [Candidatus Diapherotrites archaeon]|nr:hypothetical protein [Candidatus Diapherotrites archaeon]
MMEKREAHWTLEIDKNGRLPPTWHSGVGHKIAINPDYVEAGANNPRIIQVDFATGSSLEYPKETPKKKIKMGTTGVESPEKLISVISVKTEGGRYVISGTSGGWVKTMLPPVESEEYNTVRLIRDIETGDEGVHKLFKEIVEEENNEKLKEPVKDLEEFRKLLKKEYNSEYNLYIPFLKRLLQC